MLTKPLVHKLGNKIAMGLKYNQEPMNGTAIVGRSAHMKRTSEGAAEPSCLIGTVHVQAMEERNSPAESLRHYQTVELSGNPRSQRRPG